MLIEKNLKFGSFSYDDEAKQFLIYTNNETGPMYVKLNKIYAFAFVRFFIRICQRNWFRKGVSRK
jgi:hypothetical protein